MDNRQEPLHWLVGLWTAVLRRAADIKRVVFQNDADEAMRFYRGSQGFYQQGIGWSQVGVPPPTFYMTVNRVADLVARFGPLLYHSNPNRRATPRQIPAVPPDLWGDPALYQQVVLREQGRIELDRVKAGFMEQILNRSPIDTNLRQHARAGIDEAMIKGRGLLWASIWKPPGVPFRMACSVYDSVDNLLVDPDAESLDRATWIARWCVHPMWQVEREYGLRPGSLRGRFESQTCQAMHQDSERAGFDRAAGITADLIGYWKIYSKMGLGSRLSGSQAQAGSPLDAFGDNVFLVLAPGVPYPLNLPPEVTQLPGADGSDPNVFASIQRRIQWPIPTWVSGHWPCAILDFRPVPRRVWPMSPVRPGLGELKFLDWAYTFLANRIKSTSRDLIALKKSLSEEIKRTVLQGSDLEVLEIDDRFEDIRQAIQVLQFPQVNGDVLKLLEMIQRQFEDRVGLNELDTGTQIRSATEADARLSHMTLRSDDYAEQVEAWMTQAATLEAFATRFHLTGQDVQPVVGEAGALFFDKFLRSADAAAIAMDMEFSIESGTVRKPNRQREIEHINQAFQNLITPFFQYGMATGDFRPLNALLERWCRARGESPEGLLLTTPPPPPTPDRAPGGRTGPPSGGPT